MQASVDKVIAKKNIGEGAFQYVCQMCKVDITGRKLIVAHVKENHNEEYAKLIESFNSEKAEQELLKLVTNTAFIEDKDVENKENNGDKNGVNKDNGDVDEVVIIEEPEKYEISNEVLRMIDARTTRLENYGGLTGRISRLLGVVIDKKDEEFCCNRCDDLKLLVGDVFSHIDSEHANFLYLLYAIFPPAKKRMAQFIEAAAKRFDLRVTTENEVKQSQRNSRETTEKQKQRKKERREMKRKHKEAAEANKKVKLDYKKDILYKRHELAEIKKILETLPPGIRREKLLVKLEQGTQMINEIDAERLEKIAERVKERTTAMLEKLSPNQIRKLCMHYFCLLEGKSNATWASVLESIKLENAFPLLIDFLVLLYDHTRDPNKRSFKFGHLLVTSYQCNLIREKGIRSVQDYEKARHYALPRKWDIPKLQGDLANRWAYKSDVTLLIGASKYGRNLRKITQHYMRLRKFVAEDGKVLDVVKERFAFLLNLYQCRGVYNEELGLNFYTEDIENDEIYDNSSDSAQENDDDADADAPADVNAPVDADGPADVDADGPADVDAPADANAPADADAPVDAAADAPADVDADADDKDQKMED